MGVYTIMQNQSENSGKTRNAWNQRPVREDLFMAVTPPSQMILSVSCLNILNRKVSIGIWFLKSR